MGADGAHPLLQGWRRELAGESLLRLLRGEVALRVLPRAPHVAEQPGWGYAAGIRVTLRPW